MGKLNIAFDLDGVLVNFVEPFAKCLEELTGRDIRNSPRHDVELEYGLESKHVRQALQAGYAAWDTVEIHEGVQEFFQELCLLSSDPVYVVTKRSSTYGTETMKLCERVFAGSPFMLSMLGDEKKTQYLGGYGYYVEDRYYNACYIAKAGYTCFLVNRPWNVGRQQPLGVVRINNLLDLLPYPADGLLVGR